MRKKLARFKNNENYVTNCDLQKIWGICNAQVRRRLKRFKILPVWKSSNPNGIWFYDKQQCLDAYSDIVKTLQKNHITRNELAKMTNISYVAVANRLEKKDIKPLAKLSSGQQLILVYDRQSAINALADQLKPECRRLTDKTQEIIELIDESLITATELVALWNYSIRYVRKYLLKNNIKPKKQKTMASYGRPKYLYSRAECEAVKPFATKETTDKEPTMQTADFIPADTLDIYNLAQLKAKIPGIEAHYGLFNKSEIPEYQEIARMLRGNQKSVNLWGKMVEGIKKEVGDVGDVKQIEHTNTVKESNVVSLIKNNIKYHGCVISEESQKWLLDNGFLSVSHIKNICEYNRSAFDLFLCNSGVKPIEVFMPEMNRTEHFFYRDSLWKIHPSTKEYYQEFISNWYDANSDQLGPLTTSRAFDYMKNPAFVNNVYMRSFLHEEAVRRGDLIELDAYKGYFQAKKWSNEEIPTAKTQLITKKTETCRLPLDQSNGQLGNNIDKKAITLSVSVDIRYKLRSLSAMLDRGKSDIVSELVDKYYKEQDALGNLKR